MIRTTSSALLVFSIAFAGLSWPLAAWIAFRTGASDAAVCVFFLGLSLGPCLAGYALASRDRKQRWRRLVLLGGGLSIASFSWLGATNLELEGFFMLLISGTTGAALGHTLVTLIVGPLLFGRFLCGCWRAMVLEWLPVSDRAGRRSRFWCRLPLLGLVIVIGSAIMAVWGFGDRPAAKPIATYVHRLFPIALSFGVYYVLAIGMGLALKDQRASCKYLCPSAVILRLTSRLSLAKMAARPGACTQCGVCSRVCP